MQTNLDWEEKPLGSLCNFTNGYAFKPSDWRTLGKPIIRIQNLNGGKDFNYFQGVLPNRYEIRPGTLLFAWSGNRGTSFGPFIWNGPTGFLNQHIFKVIPGEEIEENWFFYALDEVRQRVERDAHGAIGLVHVRKQDLCKYSVFFPTNSSEQRTIAVILDTMDEAIRRTEAVIAKLRQVKAGILHDLLTRGLDENGELRDPLLHPEQFKDSPLGRIPKAWKIVPLASISDFITSGSRGWAAYYADQGPLFLRIGNLTREHINFRMDDLVHVHPPIGMEGARTRIAPEDLLISITADLGIIGCAPEEIGEAYINQHIALVRLIKEVSRRWVAHYLASPSYQKNFTLLNDAGAKAGMNLTSVGNLLISIPTRRAEQDQIVRSLDEVDGQVETTKRNLKKLISLKQGLMHDLLTGTVRVPPHLLETPP